MAPTAKLPPSSDDDDDALSPDEQRACDVIAKALAIRCGIYTGEPLDVHRADAKEILAALEEAGFPISAAVAFRAIMDAMGAVQRLADGFSAAYDK
jgi:hypothetical protein